MNRPENFIRVLIAGSMLGKAADYGLAFVVPVAIYAATGSTAEAILALALRGVAYIASPFAGMVIDAYDKRRIFVASQVGQAACVALVAVTLSHPVLLSILLLVSGIGGVASSLTGQYVLIPAVLAPEAQETATARLIAATEYAKVIGFLGAGAFVSALGPRVSAWLIALLYALAGLVTLGLPPVAGSGRIGNVRKELAVGLAWLKNADVGILVLSLGISNLGIGAITTVLTASGAAQAIDPFRISLTLAVGLVAGALGSRFAPVTLRGRTLNVKLLIFQTLVGVTILGLATAHNWWLTGAWFAVHSFTLGLSNVVSVTYRQSTIPVPLAGRVNGVIRMFMAGAIPLSGLIFALASARHWWVWGVALVLQTLSVLVWAAYVLSRRTKRIEHAKS